VADLTLERWTEVMPERLRRVESATERELRATGDRARALVRGHAPRGRTGDLERSIQVEHRPAGFEVFSLDPAALALETGPVLQGTPYMAIPLTEATRQLSGPRSDIAGLFVLRSRAGELFLASESSGAVELRWKLQHAVRVRPQQFFSAGMREALQGFPERLEAAIDREVVVVG
jgi:hypothetical protein